MFTGESLDELSHRTAFTAFRLFESSADAANVIQKFLIGEKLLIGFSTLDHDLRLAVDGEHGRMASLLELADVIARVPLKFAKRVDVEEIDRHNSRLT